MKTLRIYLKLEHKHKIFYKIKQNLQNYKETFIKYIYKETFLKKAEIVELHKNVSKKAKLLENGEKKGKDHKIGTKSA